MASYLFLIGVLLIVGLILLVVTFSNFSLNNEQYDRLKWLVGRWPALMAFLGVLIKLFNFPYGVETVTLVAAIGTLIAGLMGISNSNFTDGGAVAEDGEWVEDGDVDE